MIARIVERIPRWWWWWKLAGDRSVSGPLCRLIAAIVELLGIRSHKRWNGRHVRSLHSNVMPSAPIRITQNRLVVRGTPFRRRRQGFGNISTTALPTMNGERVGSSATSWRIFLSQRSVLVQINLLDLHSVVLPLRPLSEPFFQTEENRPRHRRATIQGSLCLDNFVDRLADQGVGVARRAGDGLNAIGRV